MKLQLALDFISISDAKVLIQDLADVIDILEIGTPFIVQEGIGVVREMKKAFPDLTILADIKIMDVGEKESAMAFQAGADIVTVLSFAGDETITAVVEQARRFGCKVMADMIGAGQAARAARAIDRLGVDYICVHTAIDRQHGARGPLDDLRQVNQVLVHARAAVAGGIKLATLPEIVREKPEIIIVGSWITGSPDKRQAALMMREIMRAGGM